MNEQINNVAAVKRANGSEVSTSDTADAKLFASLKEAVAKENEDKALEGFVTSPTKH